MIFPIEGRPPTHNQVRRQKWAGAMLTKNWRVPFAATLVGVTPFPPETRVTIDIYQSCRDKRLGDAGSIFEAAKALVDGLQDAGVIAGDGPEHVAWIRFHAPFTGDRDEVILELQQEQP